MIAGLPEAVTERLRADPVWAERFYAANPDLRPKPCEKAPSRPVKMRTDGFGSGTEAAYAQHLELRRIGGEIIGWAKQPRFGLGDGRTYTPDFAVFYADRVELIDVKGGYDWEDARIKLSWARDKYPGYRWLMVRGKQTGGVWTWTEMKIGRTRTPKGGQG